MLRNIFSELRLIRQRLDDVNAVVRGFFPSLPVEVSESSLLLMPDHLRKTYLAVASRDRESSAEEIAIITGRCRAVESNYLNQLCRAGKLLKRTVGGTKGTKFFRLKYDSKQASAAANP